LLRGVWESCTPLIERLILLGAEMLTTGAPLAALLPSWQLSLQAANKSPKTITSYTGSVRQLIKYLNDQGLPADSEGIEAKHVRAFLASELERCPSPASTQIHYRNLRVFFGWLTAEGERTAPNPMAGVDKPEAPAKAKPFFTDVELALLLKACNGQDFESRRDAALIRILIDTGVRVSGLANLRYDPEDESRNDVFLPSRRLRVRLKGGRETFIPIGAKTAAALDKYLRARARHPQAGSPWLWVGTRGHDVAHFGDSGVRSMLRRRGREAGVQGVNPHRFRHTFADNWLAAGGNVDDLMHVAGWTTYDMPLRYARGRGAARAHEAHRRLSPGDRL
jgi:site-specific recombinase XerD